MTVPDRIILSVVCDQGHLIAKAVGAADGIDLDVSYLAVGDVRDNERSWVIDFRRCRHIRLSLHPDGPHKPNEGCACPSFEASCQCESLFMVSPGEIQRAIDDGKRRLVLHRMPS